MKRTRREFIKMTAESAATLAVCPHLAVEAIGQTAAAPSADPAAITLGREALNAARSAGASYADVRIAHYRRQEIDTRERQIRGVSDNESYGFGVRVLLDGRWGFAASNVMTNAAAQSASRPRMGIHRISRYARKCGAVGIDRGGEAECEIRRGGSVGSDSGPHESLAHDP